MSSTTVYASDVAFTGSMKALQERKGSRKSYVRMEENGSWSTTITSDLAAFIAAQTSIFLATANADGQPYPATFRSPRCGRRNCNSRYANCEA